MVSYLITALMALCLFAATYLFGEWLVRRLAPRFRRRSRRMREMDSANGAPNDSGR